MLGRRRSRPTPRAARARADVPGPHQHEVPSADLDALVDAGRLELVGADGPTGFEVGHPQRGGQVEQYPAADHSVRAGGHRVAPSPELETSAAE